MTMEEFASSLDMGFYSTHNPHIMQHSFTCVKSGFAYYSQDFQPCHYPYTGCDLYAYPIIYESSDFNPE